MKVRGTAKITGDLVLSTLTSIPREGDILYSVDDEGKAKWGDMAIPEVDSTYTYDRYSLVIDPESGGIYLSVVDQADGNELNTSEWKLICCGDGDGGGGDGGGGLTGGCCDECPTYDINEDIPDNAAIENVGGILGHFTTAGQLGGKSICEVLDAILFKDDDATSVKGKVTLYLQGKLAAASTYVDISGKTLAPGQDLNIRLKTVFNPGSWSSGGTYYGGATAYTYDVENTTTLAITAGGNTNTYDKPAVTVLDVVTDYKYDVTVDYAAGAVPHTTQGNAQTGQQPAGDITSAIKRFYVGSPIWVGSFPEFHTTTGDITAYFSSTTIKAGLTAVVEAAPLDPAHSNLFLSKTPTNVDVTDELEGNNIYLYFLIPEVDGTTITQFNDTGFNVDYTGNIRPAVTGVTIDMGDGNRTYKAFLFDGMTSVVVGENELKLTVK
ncbi:MAG: hypothetical protein KAH32_07495 [Chlamydiia bacterium]|nr:hypothetical protein [Chlamydiia bacterium]